MAFLYYKVVQTNATIQQLEGHVIMPVTYHHVAR